MEQVTVTRKAVANGKTIENESPIACGVLMHISELIPAGGATIILSMDVSQMKVLILSYPESGDFTSDQSEDLAFNADTGFLWAEGDPAASKPFTSDVATLTIPNTSGADQLLTGMFGYDPTV